MCVRTARVVARTQTGKLPGDSAVRMKPTPDSELTPMQRIAAGRAARARAREPRPHAHVVDLERVTAPRIVGALEVASGSRARCHAFRAGPEGAAFVALHAGVARAVVLSTDARAKYGAGTLLAEGAAVQVCARARLQHMAGEPALCCVH